MEIFNNREIALAIWTTIGLAWLLKSRERREQIGRIIACAFALPLTKIYICMLAYVILMIYVLHKIGIWEFGQLKNTLIWSITVAPAALFKIQSIKEETGYFKKAVIGSLSVAAVLEFVVGFYSFSLIWELILLPALAFLGVVKGIAGNKSETKNVEKLVDGILIVFGVFALGYAVHNIVIGLGEFANLETLTDFYTPIVLSILYLPFIYLLSVYESYDRRFATLSVHIAEPKLRRYIKFKAFLTFGLNWSALERWFNHIMRLGLKTKEEIDQSLKEIKDLIAYEKNPKTIDPQEGWSPYDAKDYLLELGLKTTDYKRLDDEEWFC